MEFLRGFGFLLNKLPNHGTINFDNATPNSAPVRALCCKAPNSGSSLTATRSMLPGCYYVYVNKYEDDKQRFIKLTN